MNGTRRGAALLAMSLVGAVACDGSTSDQDASVTMDGGDMDGGGDPGADAQIDAGPPGCGASGAEVLDWLEVTTTLSDGTLEHTGDHADAVDFSESSCTFEGDPDVVFAYTPERDGALILGGTGLPTSYGHYVSIRRECDRVGSELACTGFVGGIDPEIALRVQGGVTLYIHVSGRLDSGPLHMTTRLVPFLPAAAACDPADLGVTCTPGLSCVDGGTGTYSCVDRCGDGAVDLGEACDDGGRADGDGCSESCEHEDQGPGSPPCATVIEELVLVPIGEGRYQARAGGDTTGAPVPESIACSAVTGTTPTPAPTAAYRVQMIPNTSVEARIVPESGFHPVLLFATEPCAASGFCDDSGGAGEVARNSFAWEFGDSPSEAYILVTGGGSGDERDGHYLLAVDAEPR